MGREVRMVPPDWVHPKYDSNHPDAIKNPNRIGNFIPKIETSYEIALQEWKDTDLPKWEEGKRLWDEGYILTYDKDSYPDKVKVKIEDYLEKRRKENREVWNRVPDNPDYYWWAGEAPDEPNPDWYMPDWKPEERTHYMMYENTSEGTPLSPAFAEPEELARWLADTGASAFAGYTARYDEWLSTIKRGSAVSAVIDGNGIRSGVEAAA